MADYINKSLKTKINGVTTNVYPYTNTDAVLDENGDTLTDILKRSTSNNVTEEEKAIWNAKSNFSGSYNDLTDKPEILNTDEYVTDNELSATLVDYAKRTDIPNVSGFAPSSHTQGASTITAGTFSGDVVAPTSTAYTTMMLRNSILTDVDSGENVSVSYPNGSLIFVYTT